MDNDSLALELLHEIKKTSKRWFILFIITLILLFTSNIIWLYSWCLPTEQTSYDIQSDDNSNAIYNSSGELNIDGGTSESNNN